MSVIAFDDSKGYKPTESLARNVKVGDYVVHGMYYQEIIDIGTQATTGRITIISTCNEQGGTSIENHSGEVKISIRGLTLKGLMHQL